MNANDPELESTARPAAQPRVSGPPSLPRGPVFIDRHDDPPDLVPPNRWDQRVRAVVASALALAALLAALTFKPTIERAFASRQAVAAPAIPATTPFSVVATARAARELDALTHEITSFRQHRTDFLARRIDCAALGSGYAAADSALTRAGSVMRAERDSLNAATVTRFTALLAAMDTVNVFFDGTRCSRP